MYYVSSQIYERHEVIMKLDISHWMENLNLGILAVTSFVTALIFRENTYIILLLTGIIILIQIFHYICTDVQEKSKVSLLFCGWS